MAKQKTAALLIFLSYIGFTLCMYLIASILTGHYNPVNWVEDTKIAFAVINAFALIFTAIYCVLILIGEIKIK